MENNIKVEQWLAVVGFEGLYEVSNMGRVRSVDRIITRSDGQLRKFKGGILKEFISSKGRLQVNLTKDKKVHRKTPHSLVALTFIGERPEGYHICHIDGDYTNNRLSNIRYDTVSQNAIDIYRHGSKSGSGKLDIEQVLEIRELYDTGKYYQWELAERYNVSQVNIGHIVNRKYFPWLNDDGTIDESQTAVS